jgi:peptidyl-prolyl cis-trans isomerase NIMA-interacting 1
MLMQSSIRSKVMACIVGFVWLAAFCPGCVVTTHEGVGKPPVAAVEERPTSKSSAANENLPVEISARHLLVQYVGSQSASRQVTRNKQEARHRAEEALARAQAGEDFATLVGEYSDEPGAKERGGSLGRFQHHSMVRQFSDAAFRLKVGQLSGVVESPFGFHVILRTE